MGSCKPYPPSSYSCLSKRSDQAPIVTLLPPLVIPEKAFFSRNRRVSTFSFITLIREPIQRMAPKMIVSPHQICPWPESPIWPGHGFTWSCWFNIYLHRHTIALVPPLAEYSFQCVPSLSSLDVQVNPEVI